MTQRKWNVVRDQRKEKRGMIKGIEITLVLCLVIMSKKRNQAEKPKERKENTSCRHFYFDSVYCLLDILSKRNNLRKSRGKNNKAWIINRSLRAAATMIYVQVSKRFLGSFFEDLALSRYLVSTRVAINFLLVFDFESFDSL